MRPRRHSNVSADLLGMPDSVRQTIRIGEFLVATATSDIGGELASNLEGELDRLNLSSDTYLGVVDEFVAAAGGMPSAWEFIALCNIATENRWIPFDQLLIGPNHARVDALLDRLGTNYCAHEIQTYYLSYVELLREASKNGWRKASEWAAAVGGGLAGGFFGVGATPAAKATEWLDERGTPPTDLTFELALFAVAWDHLLEIEDFPEADLRAVIARCDDRIRALAIQYGKRGARDADWNMWKYLVENLSEASSLAGTDTESEAPDLVGHALHAAEFQLQRLGIPHASIDGAAEDEESSRTIWNEKNWLVVAQFPLPGEVLTAGSPVVLAAAKRHERVNEHQASLRASEHCSHLRDLLDDPSS